ncbi:MAG: response regulator [Bacteroidia bacterium]|nr:response regulator [Bacteroidia bacterium]
MILIVDDRPENIFSLKSTLEEHEFKVDSALSGEEALKKILKHSYCLIILDVQMPEMDGFEVAEAISGFNKAKDIPIIFLSAANTEKQFITKGYNAGATDYITKPVDPDILLLKVKTFYKLSEQKNELNRIQANLISEIEIRKQAENELGDRIQELRSVMESLPQIAFSLNANGQIDYVNKKWDDYASAYNTFPEPHPDDKIIYTKWIKSFKKGIEFVDEVRIRKLNDKEYLCYLLRIIPVKQGANVIRWVGTFTDIQQQKNSHELLENSVRERTRELVVKNEELENRNHELQQFTWVASHDLKEPLRKIQTFSFILRDKYLKDNKEVMSYLNRTIKSSERMSSLINDLLNYSRLSVSILFKPTNLNIVIEEILSDLELTIEEKGATINLGKLPVIDAVPSQIRQVFQNLISNALKFSRLGVPPVLDITSELIAEKDINSKPDKDGKYCRLIVTDNGIGFDEKYLDRIFTIFQRLNDRESFEGTGIGLAIAKKVIDRYNGIITAKSVEGEGASFIIVLPLKQEDIYSEYKN